MTIASMATRKAPKGKRVRDASAPIHPSEPALITAVVPPTYAVRAAIAAPGDCRVRALTFAIDDSEDELRQVTEPVRGTLSKRLTPDDLRLAFALVGHLEAFLARADPLRRERLVDALDCLTAPAIDTIAKRRLACMNHIATALNTKQFRGTDDASKQRFASWLRDALAELEPAFATLNPETIAKLLDRSEPRARGSVGGPDAVFYALCTKCGAFDVTKDTTKATFRAANKQAARRISNHKK